MDLVGEVPNLSQSGTVADFLSDLKMFFECNITVKESRRRSIFGTMVGCKIRKMMRQECNLEKDPLEQLYACLERVYPTHSGSEHAANSGEKSEAAFCPESAAAAGDAGFLAGDTPALRATSRSSPGKEDEGALREKARPPSDAKISNNSQRTPASASREGSVSPTSAAPSPGAEPMADDEPVLPVDSPPGGGTLSSRPESPASARKQIQQEETPMTPVIISDDEHSCSSQTNAKTEVKVTPKTRPRPPTQKVAEELVTEPCLLCENSKDTQRLICKKCGEKAWFHLNCFPGESVDPNIYVCEECKPATRRSSSITTKQEDGDHDDDEDEDESAPETDDDDVSFSQTEEFERSKHLLEEDDFVVGLKKKQLQSPQHLVGAGTRKTAGGSTQLTSTPTKRMSHSVGNRSETHHANEDASESAMECYASSDNFGAESATHQGSTTYRRQPVQRPASLARSSSSTTQPKAVHKRPSSTSASHAPQSKRENVGTATSRSRVRQDKKDLEVLADIVRDVRDHDDADEFVQPVKFPGYQKEVKKPMDFGTIIKNVQCSDVGTVLQDVRLVFHNCKIFNEPNSEICRSAQRLECYFVELMEEHLKEVLPRYRPVWLQDKGTRFSSGNFNL